MATDPAQNESLVATVNEVAEKVTLLVREEIELAKVEVTQKVTKIVKGAAVAAVAGSFALFGVVYLLHGLAWFSWWALPVDTDEFFWGFFLVAGVLFALAGLAGLLAYRWLRAGAPPTPDLAIDEAKLIRETIEEHKP